MSYSGTSLLGGHFGTLILVLNKEVSSIQRSLNTLQYFTGAQNGVLITEVSAIQRFVYNRGVPLYNDITGDWSKCYASGHLNLCAFDIRGEIPKAHNSLIGIVQFVFKTGLQPISPRSTSVRWQRTLVRSGNGVITTACILSIAIDSI